MLEQNQIEAIRTLLNRFLENKSNLICPDQKICELVIKNQIAEPILPKESWNIEDTAVSKANKRLILILESPHLSEFESEPADFGPAKGATGTKISTHLHSKINELNLSASTNIPDGNYDLLLMNAIRFQCSLGLEPSFFRTLSFIGLWINGSREDFKRRLMTLNLNSSDVVINACTIGNGTRYKQLFGGQNLNQNRLRELFNQEVKFNSSSGLKHLVRMAIDEILTEHKSKFITRELNHPSSWIN